MSNELTEAERAVAEILLGNTVGWEDKAREIVAAVRPIIEAEITGQRAECPDLFCMGWKDSGICPNEPLYRHNP
jgi:hypothetical protein